MSIHFSKFSDCRILTVKWRQKGGFAMSSDLPRYTLRVDPTLLAKIAFIAQENDRSTNKEIERILKKVVADYEKENGPILLDNPWPIF